MSSIVIIADPKLSAHWADTLRRDKHDVDTIDSSLDAAALFAEETFDIAIVNIGQPDGGASMLVAQMRAAWPACKIVAMVDDFSFRQSAVFSMGLWSPDQILLKPVAPRLLRATVSFLAAQIRSQKLRELMSGDLSTVRRELDARRHDRRVPSDGETPDQSPL